VKFSTNAEHVDQISWKSNLCILTITTRLNAFTRSCLFNATAVAAQCHSQQTNSESFARRRHQYVRCCIALRGKQTTRNGKTDISIASFIGVYGSKFTKFSSLVEHHGDCLPWKFDGGLQQKLLRESPKTGNFCTCTCKARTVFTSGGQRPRSNVHLVAL